MGTAAPESHLVAIGFLANETKVLKARSTRRWKESKRPRMILMKRRRNRVQGCRRPANVFEKRVRVLRKLVPNKGSVGIDGLFRDTADYILALEMRVKVMQIMVKALSWWFWWCKSCMGFCGLLCICLISSKSHVLGGRLVIIYLFMLSRFRGSISWLCENWLRERD